MKFYPARIQEATIPTPAVPPWLDVMRSLDGIHASGDNPQILGMAKFIGETYPEMESYCAGYTHDSISWCGLAVGYCMAKSGIKPVFGANDTDRFLWALAWKQFGTPVAKGQEQPGDVLVFVWAGGGHHVSLYEGIEGGNYRAHGGNQSHAVNTQSYSPAYCVGIRRPSGVAVQPQPTPQPQPEPIPQPTIIPTVPPVAGLPPFPLPIIGEDPLAAAVRGVLLEGIVAQAVLLRAKADALMEYARSQGAIVPDAPAPGAQAAPLPLPLPPFLQPPASAPAPAPAPAPTILRGDGSYDFTAQIIGDNIVVRGVKATWFGGPNDPSDSGSTASGVSTRNNPSLQGVSLPMDIGAKFPPTRGSPLPSIPWQTQVRVKNLHTDIELSAPLIDLGPAKTAKSRAAIDLTEPFFAALGGDPNAGSILVDYTIVGGAKYVPASQGAQSMSVSTTDTQVAAPVSTSAWASKINVGEIVKVGAMVLAVKGINVPTEIQNDIIIGIAAFGGIYTWVMRTWFTTAITPQSAARLSKVS